VSDLASEPFGVSLSTHVLDTAEGRPAAAVPVRLEWHDGHAWQPLDEGRTDGDGRVSGWQVARAGRYRLVFDTGDYLGQDAFFPEVVVQFRIADPGGHYHVPLLLSPFGYSTYRGS
jgi:5-hydroxyisourate hydrolase